LIWILLGTLIGWLVFLCWIPEAPRVEHTHDGIPIIHVLQRPEVIAWIVACALMAVAHGPYYGFYSIYLFDHGYSKSAIGGLWALGVICEIAVFFWAPHLFRRFAPRRVLLASFALAALRFVMIGLGADSLMILLLAQVLHAASFGSFHAAAFGYVQRFFRGRHQARGQAIYSGLTFGLGGTIGGIYAGYAWDKLGGGMTFTLGAVCALAGMALFWGRVRDSDMTPVPQVQPGN
jgi:PPP family 3-phenylpropionic acid transporter